MRCGVGVLAGLLIIGSWGGRRFFWKSHFRECREKKELEPAWKYFGLSDDNNAWAFILISIQFSKSHADR